MKRLFALLVGGAAFYLPPQTQAQTEEIQALTQARLLAEKLQAQGQERDNEIRHLIEKLHVEAKVREEKLWKEIKQLQTAIQELKEQSKKGKKKGKTGAEEVEVLRAKLAEAEARAREMEQVAKAQRDRATAALEEARALAARADAIQAEMQEKIRVLERELRQAKGIKDPPPQPKDLPKVDVPKDPVKGKVTKVDPDDPALVEVDIGSDMGLKGGHTLEIYRLMPQPTYLGTLRILQVRPTRSVGRVVATNPLKKETLIKVGDQVASQIK